MKVQGVIAVVVTFHPEQGCLDSLLLALSAQVDEVIVVDNTPGGADWAAELRTITAIPNVRVNVLGENRGIAAAQNFGIKIAFSGGFDYVLFSDQDSMPQDGMVEKLVSLACERKAAGVKVGSVSPTYFDRTTQQFFRFQIHPPGSLFYRSVPATDAQPWLEVVTTISSGCLVPCETLNVAGGMREDFFIDDVDTEWCHRARSLGFHHFGTSEARLTHQLGESPFRVWYFGWREHSKYPPARLYYRFRNFVKMARLPHVPFRWSLRACWYWVENAYAYCLFAGHPFRNARAIVLGVWDGLLGRGGALCRRL